MEDAEKIQREAIALSLLGRGSRSPSCQTCCSEDKENSQGQNKRGSQEVETHRRGRKKKIDEVPSLTLG